MTARQKVGATAVVLVALSLFVLAYWARGDDDTDLAITANDAVEDLIPPRATEILRQERVGIDLAPGYSGRLTINDIRIPVDQITVTDALNLYVFQPGEGKVLEALESGRNCVTATYWETELGQDRAESTQWCFDVT